MTWLQKGCWAESQFIISTGGLKTSPSPRGPRSQHCLCCRMRVLLFLQGQRLSSPGQCRLILLSPAQNSSVIMNLALAGCIPNLLSKRLRLSTDTLPWPGGNSHSGVYPMINSIQLKMEPASFHSCPKALISGFLCYLGLHPISSLPGGGWGQRRIRQGPALPYSLILASPWSQGTSQPFGFPMKLNWCILAAGLRTVEHSTS